MAKIIYLFQFHKGTIRTSISFSIYGWLSLFQFHKGTIRTKQSRAMESQARYFNSIKVRLEPLNAPTWIGSAIFQFHKGTIRTE